MSRLLRHHPVTINTFPFGSQTCEVDFNEAKMSSNAMIFFITLKLIQMRNVQAFIIGFA